MKPYTEQLKDERIELDCMVAEKADPSAIATQRRLINALEALARVEAVRTFRLLDVEPGEVLHIEKLVRYEDVQRALEGKQ